jgi:hypothetical protein
MYVLRLNLAGPHSLFFLSRKVSNLFLWAKFVGIKINSLQANPTQKIILYTNHTLILQILRKKNAKNCNLTLIYATASSAYHRLYHRNKLQTSPSSFARPPLSLLLLTVAMPPT